MTFSSKTGIIEKIEDFNLEIGGKRYFALPNVRPYLKNFAVGDTVEFSTSKGDKGAISFLKAGHITGSQVPKETLKSKEDQAQDTVKKWDEVQEKVKAMHPEDRVQWAVKILEDLHGVPDRIETLARLIIKTREEGDQIASQVSDRVPESAHYNVPGAGGEKEPIQAAAKADNPAPPTGKVESSMPSVGQVVMQGVIESVTIGATINLGNYNNVKLEVAANNGETARSLFQREIQPTIDMVQGIIRTIDKGGK